MIKPEIDLKQFYILGMVCFFIIGAMSFLNLIRIWEVAVIYTKISSIAGIVFNMGLVMFFNYLRNQLPKIPKEDMPDEKDLENYLEGLK